MKILQKIILKLISLLDNIQYGSLTDKMVDEYVIHNLQVLTDTGYKPITNIYLTRPFAQYTITLQNGYFLTCADTHILFDKNMNEVYAKDLLKGDIIQTDAGPQQIILIEYNKDKICMGDITVDDDNHRFYSNGILSHNSTTTAIYCLWYCLFRTDINGLILSKSGPAGIDLIGKIKDMYLNLPYFLKCGTTKWNQHEIAFDSNSTIHTEAFSSTAGLGQTINFLILDEFAWTPPNESSLFYQNVIPTVTTMPDARVCIMSTQNGHNLFYDIWTDSVNGRSAYKPFKVDWWQVPQWDKEKKCWVKRDEAWKQKMVGILGSEQAFYYQYGTMFSSSDSCLINREKLSQIIESSVKFETRDDLGLVFNDNIKWHPDFNAEDLNSGFFYILVDLAEGGGGDYTVFNIFQVTDKDHFKQIARWHANNVIIEKASLEFWMLIAQLFPTERTQISIEWNTYGALFYRLLMSLNEPDEFPEYAFRMNYASEGIDMNNIVHYNKNVMDNQIELKEDKKSLPGIRFSNANKVQACTMLKMYIEQGQIEINDSTTIDELQNFEDNTGNGSYKASYGHDDLVMTLCQLPMLMQTASYQSQMEDFIAYKQYGNQNNQSYNVYEGLTDPFGGMFNPYQNSFNPYQNDLLF